MTTNTAIHLALLAIGVAMLGLALILSRKEER
jgi:LPXTG-motif cell wall-anchored protein